MHRQKTLNFYNWLVGILVISILPFAIIMLMDYAKSSDYGYRGPMSVSNISFHSYYPYQFMFSSFVAIVIKFILDLLPVRDWIRFLIALFSSSVSILLLALINKEPFFSGQIFSKSSGIYGLTAFVFMSVLILIATQNALRFNRFLIPFLIFLGIFFFQINGFITRFELFQSTGFMSLISLLLIPIGITVFFASLMEQLHWEFFSKGDLE